MLTNALRLLLGTNRKTFARTSPLLPRKLNFDLLLTDCLRMMPLAATLMPKAATIRL
ncbi:hypothetical protein BRAS3843_1480030 [Bradyrhizobium sp. STM 3843]|nr:hypothetical protein BRAS3843_1480030 [Bradyrhizobium sp. STM 3843]